MTKRLRRLLTMWGVVIVTLALAGCFAGSPAAADPVPAPAPATAPRSATGPAPAVDPQDFFRDRIRPILADSCWRCHGERRQKSGLRLDSRAGLLHGGHGVDVEVGHPESSRLMDALSYEDEDLRMPPDGKLSDAQIADLANWIRLGASWDDRPAPAQQGTGTSVVPDR